VSSTPISAQKPDLRQVENVPRPAPLRDEYNPVQKFGFNVLTFDIATTVSRFPELVVLLLHFQIPFLVMGPRVIDGLASVFSGGAARAIRTKLGASITLFTAWIFLTTLFSTWKYGSVQTLLWGWLPSFLTFLGTASLLETPAQCKRTVYNVGIATSVVAALAFVMGGTNGEARFQFDAGTLGNSNELATILLFGAPLLFLPFLQKGGSKIGRLVSAGGIVCTLMIVLKTASRAAFLAMILLFILTLFNSSGFGKLKMLIGAGFLLTIGVLVAPQSTLVRYKTIFQDAEGAEANAEAYASKSARQETLQESLWVTATNPLFGVGPGVYVDALAGIYEAQGLRPRYTVTHNSFTQVSAENGIPGFLFYFMALFWSIRNQLWIRKQAKLYPQLELMGALASCLFMSTLIFCLNSFFGSFAYQFYFPMLFGLSVSFRYVTEKQLRTLQPATPYGYFARR
jgi:O-antigen ligase